MEIIWEKGAESTVHQTARQDFIIRSASFTLGESTGETSESGIFFFVLYLKRHKICSGNCVLGGTNSSQQHGIAHAQHYRTVCLFCQLSRFERDGSSIRQLDCLDNWVNHKKVLISIFFQKFVQRYRINFI